MKGFGDEVLTQSFSINAKMLHFLPRWQCAALSDSQTTYRGEKQTDMLARRVLSPAERLECTRALSVNYWIKMLL